MDFEVELNYRLAGHLERDEKVLATLLSVQHGIYAATDQRILCLNTERIGYRMRVHRYSDLERVECLSEDGASFILFVAGARHLTIRVRSHKEAERFAESVSNKLATSVE